MTITTLIAAAICFLLCLVLTWVMRSIAPRLGLVDNPDGYRKLHGRPIALGGGLAVFAAVAMVVAGLVLVPNPLSSEFKWSDSLLPFLFLASVVVVVLGVIDDRFKLRGRYKLLGQLFAASLLMVGGLQIGEVSVFGNRLHLGYLAIPFTLFWLLGAINAVNLLDGIDGLATTIGIILSLAIAVMAIAVGRPPEVAIMSCVLAAALIGFLCFNFPPATIFLGDAGSMFIGLMVGALSIEGSLKGAGTVLLAAPLAVWTIPVFDSVAAIIRRTLTGRSIYATDRAHLHHRLLELLGSNRRVLALVAVSCAITSSAALASVLLANDLLAVIVAFSLVLVFVITGAFGRAEVLLVGLQFRRLGNHLLPSRHTKNGQSHTSCIRFHGSQAWELLWEELTDSVDALNLNEVHLDVNLPFAKEGCHALWQRKGVSRDERCWSVRLPVVVHDKEVGWLRVVGAGDEGSRYPNMRRLLATIEAFDGKFCSAMDGESAPADTPETLELQAAGKSEQSSN